MTVMPAATPMDLVSTTATGKSSICLATRWQVWLVAESPEEMVTTTAFS